MRHVPYKQKDFSSPHWPHCKRKHEVCIYSEWSDVRVVNGSEMFLFYNQPIMNMLPTVVVLIHLLHKTLTLCCCQDLREKLCVYYFDHFNILILNLNDKQISALTATIKVGKSLCVYKHCLMVGGNDSSRRTFHLNSETHLLSESETEKWPEMTLVLTFYFHS